MSFNLNKSEEPFKKTSFDLSKGNAASDVAPRKKSGKWIYFLITFVAICGFAWYFTRQNVPAELPAVSKADPVTVQTDTERVVQKDSTIGKTDPVSKRPRVADPSEPALAASFPSGSAIPRRIANSTTARIREKVKNGLMVMVFGYASSEGDLTFNQAIAQARAEAYKKHLIRSGVAGSRITAQGKGIENPIASNDTETGRAKNRRVEVIFQ